MIEIFLIVYAITVIVYIGIALKCKHEFDTLQDLLQFAVIGITPMANILILLYVGWQMSATISLRKAEND